MHTPRVSLIAALGERTRAIGKGNSLLWHIPGDLPRFKALTAHHPIVMGSTTFTSIGHPLPDRTNIVVTHDPLWSPSGVVVCHSIEEALHTAAHQNTDEVFVIGGGSIYTQTIDRADRLYLTLVDDDTPGDTFFPDYTKMPFRETTREETTGKVRSTFVVLERLS